MNVTQLAAQSLFLAISRYPELHKRWVDISFKIGALLPDSLIALSLQQIGRLDLLLLSMEDELAHERTGGKKDCDPILNSLSTDWHNMLAGIWVGSAYEIMRLVKSRKLFEIDQAFQALEYDLALIRMPLDKQEIASDKKLKEPLVLHRFSEQEAAIDPYVYSKEDSKRSHIMPLAFSERGSLMWQVVDIERERSVWFERRSLSNRMMAFWEGHVDGFT